MLYWFGVYALVVGLVLVPFLFLYMGVVAWWLGGMGIRFAIRGAKHIAAVAHSWNHRDAKTHGAISTLQA
jgi:hypothetical protein